MEREQELTDRQQQHHATGGVAAEHGLDQTRSELDGLLEIADQVFDNIGHIDAQDYLHQNLQTGGQ